jgi:hypothetical protein
MRFHLRAIIYSLSPNISPLIPSEQLDARNAAVLDERSDRIPPKVEFPTPGKKKDPKTAPTDPPPADKNGPALTTTMPLPLPPTKPPPGPAPATVTVTSVSTSTLTSYVNITFHDLATDFETATKMVSTTLLTTATVNQTLTTTATSTLSAPAHTLTVSPTPVPEKKHVSTAGVLAVVSGVANLALLVVMFFLVRRFYRMYRAERVLRKQTQTEGVELAGSKHVEGGPRSVASADLERKDQWSVS